MPYLCKVSGCPVFVQADHLSDCLPLCRDAEVLSLFAAIITKLRELMAPEVPRVFEAIFECTLQMITKNFAVRPWLHSLLRITYCMFSEAVLILASISLDFLHAAGGHHACHGSHVPAGCKACSAGGLAASVLEE